jgi:hypothetical protein
VGLLYLAKVHRRPVRYRFLPIPYTSYLALCVRRAVMCAVLLSAVFYLPLYWYIEKGLGLSYTVQDSAMLLLGCVAIACAAALIYVLLLRPATVSSPVKRKQRLVVTLAVIAGATGALHWYVLDAWGAALRQAGPLQLGAAALCVLAGVVALAAAVRSQQEHPLSQAAAVRAGRNLHRAPLPRRAAITRRTIVAVLNARQLDIMLVTLAMSAAVVALGFVMRFADTNVAVVAQTVVVAVLPYVAALYTISARGNLYGLTGDGLRFLPVDMPGFAKYSLLVAVMWQVVLTLVLVVLVSSISRIPLDIPGVLDFACVATVIACLAYVFGTIFYGNTIGNRIAAVALFAGSSFAIQGLLQELTKYKFGLALSAFGIVLMAAWMVTALERTRRSSHVGA